MSERRIKPVLEAGIWHLEIEHCHNGGWKRLDCMFDAGMTSEGLKWCPEYRSSWETRDASKAAENAIDAQAYYDALVREKFCLKPGSATLFDRPSKRS